MAERTCSEADVRAIRDRYAAGHVTFRALAGDLSVTEKTIWDVVSWAGAGE